jgi:hypothetical protein
MSIIQISKIQVRSGNIDQLPQLSTGEFGWATDTYQLFIGNNPNVIGPSPDNTEILTQYSTIDINAAGFDTDVMYNENGVLAGSNNFTWTDGTSTLDVNGTITVNNLYADTITTGILNLDELNAVTINVETLNAGTINSNISNSVNFYQNGAQVLDVNSVIDGGTY